MAGLRDYNSSFRDGYGFSEEEEKLAKQVYKHRPNAMGSDTTKPKFESAKPKPKPKKKPAGGMSRNERNLRRRQGRL